MGTIAIRYLGLVRNTLGKQEEAVELPSSSTVRDLLRTLSENYGDAFRVSVMTADGSLRPSVRILVDGNDIEEVGDLDTSLGEASQVSVIVLVSPFVGG